MSFSALRILTGQISPILPNDAGGKTYNLGSPYHQLIEYRMALSNMALVTFLALKNTPLSILISYSYERLNQLHQIGGYTTATYAMLHVILTCIRFSKVHELGIFLERAQIYGMIAVSAIFIMITTAILMRKIQYEVFYIIHLVMYTLVVIGIGMHRPNYALKSAIITTFAGSIWAFDRILRGSRLLWNYQTFATLTPLVQGGTRVELHRPSSRDVPGSHCLLWMPKIRLIETHPFTIVSASRHTLEFVIAAQDGFTKALHQYALLHPGAKLRASIDGPYGALSNVSNTVDKLVLIAGGSGASFTFGVALDTIRRPGESSKTTIDFIWSVKEYGTIHLFTPFVV